jgi:hypothetical protein
MVLLMYPCDKYGFLARYWGLWALFVFSVYTALDAS